MQFFLVGVVVVASVGVVTDDDAAAVVAFVVVGLLFRLTLLRIVPAEFTQPLLQLPLIE